MRQIHTIEEWERVVGEQVRDGRVAQNFDQGSLAAMANISVGALSNLERGKGSSLSTVVAVVRALGRTDWLEGLAPPVTVSPMQILRSKRGAGSRRVRVRKPSPKGEADQ